MRNEKAEDFLSLLKEWKNFCEQFSLLDTNMYAPESSLLESDDVEDDKESNPSGELEVQKLVDICVGDPYKKKETALYFKVPIYFSLHFIPFYFYLFYGLTLASI